MIYSIFIVVSHMLLSSALDEFYHTEIPGDSPLLPAGTRLARLNVLDYERNLNCKFKEQYPDKVLATAHHKAGQGMVCILSPFAAALLSLRRRTGLMFWPY